MSEVSMTDYIETPLGTLSSKSIKSELGDEQGIVISLDNKTVAYVLTEEKILRICAWVPDNFGTPNYKAEVVLP